MRIFLFGGVGGAVASMIAGYILQFHYGALRETDNPARDDRTRSRIHWLAAAFASVSLLAFIAGVSVAASAFPGR